MPGKANDPDYNPYCLTKRYRERLPKRTTGGQPCMEEFNVYFQCLIKSGFIKTPCLELGKVVNMCMKKTPVCIPSFPLSLYLFISLSLYFFISLISLSINPSLSLRFISLHYHFIISHYYLIFLSFVLLSLSLIPHYLTESYKYRKQQRILSATTFSEW